MDWTAAGQEQAPAGWGRMAQKIRDTPTPPRLRSPHKPEADLPAFPSLAWCFLFPHMILVPKNKGKRDKYPRSRGGCGNTTDAQEKICGLIIPLYPLSDHLT